MESFPWSKGRLMLETAADIQSILSIDLGLLLGLFVLARVLNPARANDRVVFGMTAGSLLLTYVFWRGHDTLPPPAFSMEDRVPHIFFCFEFLALLYTFMSLALLFLNI